MAKKIKVETRCQYSILKIKMAFWGATGNLYLLEESLAKLCNITLYQYINYLSQLAFCIELGLKSIIINSNDFEHIHEISYLYSQSPDAFKIKFESRYNKELLSKLLSKTENIFENFRYIEINK
jgi:hypothetical protein